jgi:signal transduction histidine kinase
VELYFTPRWSIEEADIVLIKIMDGSNWLFLGTGLVLGLSVWGVWELWVRLHKSRTLSDLSLVSPSQQHSAKELQQQLKQTQLAYYMAREMSQFKAGFLARTTHVLRSPINGLINLHQLILSNLCENPEEEREFIYQAQERALKLLKLIDEILKVARLEHGTNKLNIQSRSLAELLQSVYDSTYMLAENRNFPFNLVLPPPEIEVLVDFCWCRQVLLYLIEAAIEQMEEGSIDISSLVSPTNDVVYIWLDVPSGAISLSEPIDYLIASEHLLTTNDIQDTASLAGMKLLLAQVLLEVMASKLEVISCFQSSATTEKQLRLQISLPLATKSEKVQTC